MGDVSTGKVSYFNRELSWLEFNRRVLDQAKDASRPLLERLKFLAIVSSNFDEFFMVRVASLKRQVQNGNYITCPSGMSPREQLQAIMKSVREILNVQYDCLLHDLLPQLSELGIVYRSANEYTEAQRATVQRLFTQEVFPLLTPVRFDPSETFINFSNLRIHIAFRLRKILGEEETNIDVGVDLADDARIAIVQIPSSLPRIVSLPEKKNCYGYTFLEQLIIAHGKELFPGYEIIEHLVFRLIRDADFSVDEYREDDFVEAMERVLHNRDRSSVVRMTHSGNAPLILSKLQHVLRLDDSELFDLPMPLDPSVFMDIAFTKGYDALREEPWRPIDNISFLPDEPVWESIARGDILLSLPYESFNPVVRMVEEASVDPHVLAIKMTLYRTSGDSPIVQALEQAARNGKHVTVMVEIKARFDEQRNIAWAERLSEAGGIVVYGIVGLKVHAKALMVVRREDQGIKRYVHLSTGNYNDKTARIYSDLCLFTARDDFAYETGLFFNAITGYSAIPGLNTLSMAPNSVKPRLLQLIEREIEVSSQETPGLIMVKLNSLVDADMIEALYKASAAHVRVLLNIRGICMLVPQRNGLSENIWVSSVLDRFLEHARIMYFRNGGNDEIFLSSADWMPRNLEGRVELLFPIEDAGLKQQIRSMLDVYFSDTRRAYALHEDGSYSRILPKGDAEPLASQAELYKIAKKMNDIKKFQDKKEFSVRRKPVKQ